MNMKHIRSILQSYEEIELGYLFGSQAKGTATNTSDVDIGIVLQRGTSYTYKDRVDLALEIEDVVNKEVDLKILNDAHPRFLNQVLTYGKLIYKKNERARTQFETSTRRQYLDRKHHIEQRNNIVKKQLTQ